MGGKKAQDSIYDCPPNGVIIAKTCVKQKGPESFKMGSGDHGKIYNPETGRLVTVVPMRDIGRGLFIAIIKALAAGGFSLFILGQLGIHITILGIAF